jgi:hypothetical protein
MLALSRLIKAAGIHRDAVAMGGADGSRPAESRFDASTNGNGFGTFSQAVSAEPQVCP